MCFHRKTEKVFWSVYWSNRNRQNSEKVLFVKKLRQLKHHRSVGDSRSRDSSRDKNVIESRKISNFSWESRDVSELDQTKSNTFLLGQESLRITKVGRDGRNITIFGRESRNKNRAPQLYPLNCLLHLFCLELFDPEHLRVQKRKAVKIPEFNLFNNWTKFIQICYNLEVIETNFALSVLAFQIKTFQYTRIWYFVCNAKI